MSRIEGLSAAVAIFLLSLACTALGQYNQGGYGNQYQPGGFYGQPGGQGQYGGGGYNPGGGYQGYGGASQYGYQPSAYGSAGAGSMYGQGGYGGGYGSSGYGGGYRGYGYGAASSTTVNWATLFGALAVTIWTLHRRT